IRQRGLGLAGPFRRADDKLAGVLEFRELSADVADKFAGDPGIAHLLFAIEELPQLRADAVERPLDLKHAGAIRCYNDRLDQLTMLVEQRLKSVLFLKVDDTGLKQPIGRQFGSLGEMDRR